MDLSTKSLDTADAGTRTGRPTAVLVGALSLPVRVAGGACRHLGAVLAVLVVAAAACWAIARRTLRWAVDRLGAIVGWSANGVARTSYAVRVAVLRARASVATPEEAAVVAPLPDAVPIAATFHATVSHNPYLPPGASRLDAIVEVNAIVEPGDHCTPRAEVVLLDCSGSMGRPWSRLRAARRAVGAAVDALPDGTWFAVVRGDHRALMLYPSGTHLVAADDESRAAAKRALRRVWPEGGTAMGRWLLLARELVATRPGVIAHALLVTDGRDESESADELRAAVEVCIGALQCDCRGVGVDWEPTELGAIAAALGGSADIVDDAAALGDDLAATTATATARHIGDVALEVRVPHGARIRSFEQCSPALEQLIGRWAPSGPATRFATGAWGSEVRHFRLSIDLPPHDVGQELLAARVAVICRDEEVARAPVTATWSTDTALTDVVDPAVGHYAAQIAIVEHVRDGLAARAAGADDIAAAALGQAARLAAASGHDATSALLERVVEVDESGVDRLRERSRADDLTLATRSTRTLRLARPPDAAADA